MTTRSTSLPAAVQFLVGKVESLFFGQLRAGAGTLQQIHPQMRTERLLDDFVVMLSGARGGDLERAEHGVVYVDGGFALHSVFQF